MTIKTLDYLMALLADRITSYGALQHHVPSWALKKQHADGSFTVKSESVLTELVNAASDRGKEAINALVVAHTCEGGLRRCLIHPAVEAWRDVYALWNEESE